jgi:integrase
MIAGGPSDSRLVLDFLPHLATLVAMPHLSPPTLTESEVQAILAATAGNPRDHLIYSLALGTGLRLAELVGLNVGDVYARWDAPIPRQDPRRDREGGDIRSVSRIREL